MVPVRSLVFSAAVLSGTLALAQTQKPDFSGVWLLTAPPSVAAQHPGQEQTIAQTETTLTMGHASEGGGHSMTYRLDGRETESLIAGIRLITRASWDGRRLILTYRAATDAEGDETTLVLSLDDEGNLVMESKPRPADGPGDPPRTVWRKRSAPVSARDVAAINAARAASVRGADGTVERIKSLALVPSAIR